MPDKNEDPADSENETCPADSENSIEKNALPDGFAPG